MEAHFVTFFSPGTFVAEQSTRPIASWDPALATEMSKSITERYNATPYGFQFTTRTRTDEELDSRVTARSAMYYPRARVETLAQVEERADPKESILRSNMRCNGYDRIARNASDWQSWAWCVPLYVGDVVLDEEQA